MNADNSFDKSMRLLSASDFDYLRSGANQFSTKFLRVYFKKSQTNSSKSRIGISASKKVGKAHDRNLCKRVIREFFRTSAHKEKGHDFLVLVSPFLFKNSENPAKDLRSSLEFAFKKLTL